MTIILLWDGMGCHNLIILILEGGRSLSGVSSGLRPPSNRDRVVFGLQWQHECTLGIGEMGGGLGQIHSQIYPSSLLEIE